MDAEEQQHNPSATPTDTSPAGEDISVHLRMQQGTDDLEQRTPPASTEALPPKPAEDIIRLVTLPPKRPNTEDPATESIIPIAEKTHTKTRTHEQQEKARRRQAVYLQKRREKKKRRIVYNRLRTLFRLLFCLILSVGAYFFAVWHFWYFSPDQFRLHGNHLLTQQHLLRFVEPLAGKPIYEINPSLLQKQIQHEIPLIETVYVRRHLLPIGLDITVIEKPSWGILYTTPPITNPPLTPTLADNAVKETEPDPSKSSANEPSKPMYLLHWDNSMTDLAPYKVTPELLKTLENPIPVVSGKMTLKAAQLKRYRLIANFLDNISPKLKLLYLDVTQPHDIYAYFEGFKVSLGRADSTIMPRISRLTYLIPTIQENQDRIQLVDLRWNQQVIFKKSNGDKMTPNGVSAQTETPQRFSDQSPQSSTGAHNPR